MLPALLKSSFAAPKQQLSRDGDVGQNPCRFPAAGSQVQQKARWGLKNLSPPLDSIAIPGRKFDMASI